ncbi:MAG: LacI family DNA-binding transcriptional regulator [Candidatus Marinimicrobia bacterium]|nr:LacI family DNA-binding transcriptional regulator [Candidatus Neomarinimicrobiota bacterium]
MKQSNPTLKDLANELGVSISTVSRALHQHPTISKETIEKARGLAEKMGYYPNGVAKSLQQKSTTTIGVIVPEIRHYFFSLAIDGIEDVAYRAGYTINMSKSNEDVEREVLNTESMISNRIAGLIASVSQTTIGGLHFQRVVGRGIPLVFFDRVLDDIDVNKVISNDFDRAYKTVEHLVESGYRRIAHLAGPKQLVITRERLHGYRAAQVDHGLEINEEMIIFGDLNESAGESGARLLLGMQNPPDAICAVNDPVAIGAFRYIRERGLRIPEDIGITGFSNNPITSMIDPPLTTVDQHGYEMGQLAASILLAEIKGHRVSRPETHVIKANLIIRKSSQLARHAD